MTNRANQAIDKLYKDLFDRAADEGGGQYWFDEMQKDWEASGLDENSTDAEKQAVWDNILAETEREIKSGLEYKEDRIEEIVENKYNQELFRSSTDEEGGQYWVDEGLELHHDSENPTNFDQEAFDAWGETLANQINVLPEAQLQDMYVEALGGPAGVEGLQYWLDPSIANPLHSGSDWDYGDDNPTNYGATFDPGVNNWLGIADPLGDAASTTGFINNMTGDDVLAAIIAGTDADGNEFNSLSGNLQTFYNPELSQFQEGTRASTIGANNPFFTEGMTSAGLGSDVNIANLLESTGSQLSDLQTTPELVDFDGDPETAPIPVATGFGAVHTGDTSVYDQELLDYMTDNAQDGWAHDPRQTAAAAPLNIGGGPAMGDPFINLDPEDPYTGPGSDIPGAGGEPEDRIGDDIPWTDDTDGPVDLGPPPPGEDDEGEYGPTIPLDDDDGLGPGDGNPMPDPTGPVDDGPGDGGPGDGGPGDGGPGDGGPGGDYPGWPDYGYGGYDPVGGVRIRKPGRNYKNASGWFSRSGKRLSSNPDLKIAPNNLNPVYM